MIHAEDFSDQDTNKVKTLFNEWVTQVQNGDITQIRKEEFKIINLAFGNSGRSLIVIFEGWQA